MSLVEKLFGSFSDRELKKVNPITKQVLALEPKYQAMSDADLQAQTAVFKQQLAEGKTLDDILPDAFAVCREAAWRVLGMKHFPVQVTGGIALHRGDIAEMQTGEGKTLVATLPAYLNALTGEGVHIVTVNDYLAKRDSEWMGKLYRWLGLTVGLIVQGMDGDARRAAYNADITYGTNNEFGFDYLRDNMVTYKANMVQRGHAYAIVDEVDSILIDEARTPLIISGRGEDSSSLYTQVDRFVRTLRKSVVVELEDKVSTDEQADGDYVVDEKHKTCTLTAAGIKKAEAYFKVENLAAAENMTLAHHIDQAIKAYGVMQRDIDYVVKDGQVIIVDEFTGRLMFGRRYSEGLHQAIEAKEHVTIERESRTLATITFQNYFRMYHKLSGMTGTAKTEEDEFQNIYSLDVVQIPTNKPNIRKDLDDMVYKTKKAKFNAVVDAIAQVHANGQPVLVGTVTVETSEMLSAMLQRRGIQHEVLNAKNHAKEAEIVAQAGHWGAVTIATNMAGRGTDILLGGNPEFLARRAMRQDGYDEEIIEAATGHAEDVSDEILAAREKYQSLYKDFKRTTDEAHDRVLQTGGLHIIGTERHESRRIDNQLRGRSGRQGDPGHSQFFLSAEDDLLRLFAGDRFYNILNNFKAVGDMPIEAGILSKSIESAQKKVEANNFATRRNVLEFDDVMNEQRKKIYSERNQVLDGADLHETIQKMINDYFDSMVQFYCPSSLPENEWNLAGMKTKLGWIIGSDSLDELKTPDDYLKYFLSKAEKLYNDRKQKYGAEIMSLLERKILLQNVDRNWMDHLDAMEELKRGIYLRSYGQQNPIVAFRMESYDMFEEMTDAIREGTVTGILTVVIRTEADTKREQQGKITSTSGATDGSEKKQPIKKAKKPGRNDPCPCGSGKKYKYCCGKDD